MTDVEQRLRDLHAQAKPDPIAVNALLHATTGLAKEKKNFAPRLWPGYGSLKHSWKVYLATACIACLMFTFVGFSFHEHGSLNERIQRTVREVAMNHMTRLESEHKSDNLAELDENMQQLSFSLKVPEHLQTEFTVAGSRYCSLAGHLAAHIKLLDKSSGELASLFVASLEHDLESIGTKSKTIAGVDVELFNENGLFYALASR